MYSAAYFKVYIIIIIQINFGTDSEYTIKMNMPMHMHTDTHTPDLYTSTVRSVMINYDTPWSYIGIHGQSMDTRSRS